MKFSELLNGCFEVAALHNLFEGLARLFRNKICTEGWSEGKFRSFEVMV